MMGRPSYAKLIREARQRITGKRAWTRNTLARDARGESVSPRSNDASAFCALGTIARTCAGHDLETSTEYDLINFVESIARKLYYTTMTLSQINDLAADHAGILRVFDQAEAVARERGL